MGLACISRKEGFHFGYVLRVGSPLNKFSKLAEACPTDSLLLTVFRYRYSSPFLFLSVAAIITSACTFAAITNIS